LYLVGLLCIVALKDGDQLDREKITANGIKKTEDRFKIPVFTCFGMNRRAGIFRRVRKIAKSDY